MGFVYDTKLFKSKTKYKFLRDNKNCMQEELFRTKNIISTCTSIGYLECHEGEGDGYILPDLQNSSNK